MVVNKVNPIPQVLDKGYFNCVLGLINEGLVSFKELEQKIFAFVCELGREIAKVIQESYDKELAEGCDKKRYRGKGGCQTSIMDIPLRRSCQSGVARVACLESSKSSKLFELQFINGA